LTLSGVIADGGSNYGITINSAGTLTLSGTNTYTGNTTISNGTLKIGKAGVISDSSDLVVDGTFDMNGFSETIASLSGSGTVTSSRVASVNSDDSGLIVYLDAGSYSGSGNWLDLTDGSPNATLGNSPSFNSDTNSFTLNGTNQYFSLGTTSTLQFGGTANYTINVWFKTDDASVNQSLLTRFDGSVLGSYRLDISNGKLLAHREANPWQTIGVTNINDGEINFASMTYNGTTLSLYLNGVLESSANIGSIGNNTIEALIGSVKSNGTRTNFFDGDIYSVQVYNTALSAETLLGNTKVELTTSSNSSTAFSGVIENGNAAKVDVTKAGSGTLTLSANNTYTGQTNINAGTVSITHNNALGSTDGATIIASGASLSISNNITSPENITINGTGISSNGAIRNTANDNTLTGLITLGANSEIQIDTGSSLTLNPSTGNAITGAYNLTIDSVGTSTISDPIAISTGDLTKTGAGTLTLSGTNSYTGDTTISAGTIKLTGSVNTA
ncbi:MAG: hypothetical protein EBW08_04425, partial [Pelagibacteraceae bacterium]|nr:hypothetical protein [Pelagibacteraceae bacterium]